ncbi:glutamate racemase [Candidatus Phycosocius spiralis]|uniref:Glutamate racemase n=1 Tax=Candidatus Phycosocius spiralis TaxID=2815099 RepID=A0ABQ4PV46_9PROT|nr:glutamate racemase [Candidatus Phycosocius spiralis]GIU66902.1 glutamate racemase [Candidatus Phycosocius spiralis]
MGLASKRPRVLVFDSGLGGLSVIKALMDASIGADIFHLADTAFFPYGEREDDALIKRIPSVIGAGIAQTQADLVIIACNTASTLALEEVRVEVSIPVVGVVPAIKPAVALSQTGVIGLLATPKTVTRPYTDALINRFSQGKIVLRHGAIGLAGAAEEKLAHGHPDPLVYQSAIQGLLDQPRGDQIDVIVLACTHYPLVLEELAAATPRPFQWVESGPAIARRVAHLLANQFDKASPCLEMGFTTGGQDGPTQQVLLDFGFEATATLSVMKDL